MSDNSSNLSEPPSMYDRIDELESQLSAAQDKIISLESDIERLKNFIWQAIETGPKNGQGFQGWEVMNTLFNWAKK